MIVHITFETSPRKDVYSRTEDLVLATLPCFSYTAKFRKTTAISIKKLTLCILEGSF